MTTERSAESLTQPRTAGDVTDAVARLLEVARAARASDLHLLPTRNGLQVTWRLDGVVQPLATWPRELAPNVVSRLKVLAELLTYRVDLPQEGRLRPAAGSSMNDPATADIEMRLSTFPTLHGEKAAIRLFVGSGDHRTLDQLGLPDPLLVDLRAQLAETSGCLVFAGPAGSGKTTTAYACLRELLARHGGRSVVTLEDPIEAELPGVAQTQVHRPAEFTYAVGLRSLMRQDPDVILVGEIRDRETADTTFQASLTGHLVLTTLHAGSAAHGVSRLRDLGVESYRLRAGLRGVFCQRLLRRCCECQLRTPTPRGCPACWETGYRGRLLIAECLLPARFAIDSQAGSTDWTTAPIADLRQLAEAAGLRPLNLQAQHAIAAGLTTTAEAARVLGGE